MHAELVEHTPLLRELAYRMLGTRADAEDVVQDTFVRALERPPRDAGRPWRPWLVRVAMNLARDRLRRRKAAPWRGPWLPEPVLVQVADPSVTPADRVERTRMAGYAWLVALEALTPEQRAVLVLREVWEHDVATTAELLGCSTVAVRALHSRARRRLRRPRETSELEERAVFGRLLQALYEGDADALSEVLAPDVRYVADADGRYQSVGIPVQGRDRVARVLLGLRRFLTDGDEVTLRPTACGVAMVLRRRAPKGRQPPMAATLLSVDGRGRIEGVYTVLVPEKLATVASDSVSSGRR